MRGPGLVGLKNLGCGYVDFSRIRGGSDGLFFSKQFQGLHHGCLLFGRETRRRDVSLAGFYFLGSLVGFFHVAASCSDDDDDDGLSHHFLWKIHMFLYQNNGW